jgi:hypothetical protein
VSSTCRKISVRLNVVSKREEGENYCHFEPNISEKTASRNFKSSTNFAVLIKIYLPWKFQISPMRRSPKTPEGGSTRKTECPFQWSFYISNKKKTDFPMIHQLLLNDKYNIKDLIIFVLSSLYLIFVKYCRY